MPEAKKCPAELSNGQGLSSDQAEAESPLSTRGADSTRRPTVDSYVAVAQGAHSASFPGSLQPWQDNRAPECINPDSNEVPPGSEANRSLGLRLADQSSVYFPGTSSSGKLKVRLCNHALWFQFSRQQNEMILTKQGRAMFPFLVYEIQGMDPSARYEVFVEVEPVDHYHWRYECGKWLHSSTEKEDNLQGNRFYQHPDSPNTGAHWMGREISFKKLKLTNKNTACNNGSQVPILLKSHHKYQPRLHIEEISNGKQPTLASSSRHTFTFPDTDFITVTAYKNPGITHLKIQNNPFAKAHRGGPSSPGQSLQKAPPAGERSDCNSSPPSLLVSNSSGQVQEGPGQDKDCDLMPRSQPPSGHLFDSRDNRSTMSLALPSTMEGLNPEPLPCTFPNAKSYHLSTDTPITQGNWPPSPSNCTSNGNNKDCHQSGSPKPQQAGTGPEEEERVQEPLCQSSSRSPSDVSHMGQRSSKRRCLSPMDSAQDTLASGLKTREEEDMCLVASEYGGNSSQETVSETSYHPVVQQEDPGHTKEKMNPTPGNSIQETQLPSEHSSDCTDLDLNSVLSQLLPSISPTTILYEASPDTPITPGNWPPSPSTCTSNGNVKDCLQSGSPKPQQAGTGTEKEERVQEPLCQSSSRSPSDIPHLGQRSSKRRCLSPVDSAQDTLASGLKTREEEDMCLIASECGGNSSQETVSEMSCHPVVQQEDPSHTKEKMNPTPGNSIQETQPPSELSFDSNPCADIHQFCPSSSQPALPYHTSPDIPIAQESWQPCLSPFISNGSHMNTFQPGSPKPQKADTWMEELERLDEQLCPSSSWSPSDLSHLDERTCINRCLSPMDSTEDFLASSMKSREQEDMCLVARESSGNSSQEPIPEGSCSLVGLQKDTVQVKERNSTAWDSNRVSQPPLQFPFDSNCLDQVDAIHHFFPSISPPAIPYEPSPNTHITQGNWPPSLSNCTSNMNSMECLQSGNPKPQQECTGNEEEERLQEPLCQSNSKSPSDVSHLGQRTSKKRCLSPVDSAKYFSASALKAREQEVTFFVASESSGNSSQEAVSEASCYPVVLKEDTSQAKGKMNFTPWLSIQEAQQLSELSFASDLCAVIHQYFPSTSPPALP